MQNLYTGERLPLSALQGKYIAAISGIARPESFEEKLTQLGAELVFSKQFADHHRFTDQELKEFHERCVRRDLDFAVTTEKDAVRFPAKFDALDVPIVFLRVEIEILSGHESWEKLVNRICKPQPLVAPESYYV